MKKNKVLILLILVGIILFGFLFYKAYKDFFNKEGETKVVDQIELYGYTLDNNDTDIYKDTFKQLSNILNTNPIDYEKYAENISKLFLIDLFTLDNKLGSTDIGGEEFIHPDLKDNFKENMGYTMYKTVEVNLDGTRTQELPIVKNVLIDTIKDINYKYNDNEYNAYEVKAIIEYEKDLDYQKEITLVIIKDDNMLYIVKGN